jgi:hypothetical protein
VALAARPTRYPTICSTIPVQDFNPSLQNHVADITSTASSFGLPNIDTKISRNDPADTFGDLFTATY